MKYKGGRYGDCVVCSTKACQSKTSGKEKVSMFGIGVVARQAVMDAVAVAQSNLLARQEETRRTASAKPYSTTSLSRHLPPSHHLSRVVCTHWSFTCLPFVVDTHRCDAVISIPSAGMFAYHTPTRMKSSAIVQGLKSWASALHPQLPLSRRESQRLLTALTSSFRRQLDEAHPPHDNSDARLRPPSSGDGALKSERSHGMHSSSATFADRHMASVLTNPLLAQGRASKKPDAATVTVELQKHPSKDPIEVLEEYHENGHANIPIALACLDSAQKSLEGLSENEKAARIRERAVGKRTLLWLSKTEMFKDEAFIENKRFALVMVDFVIKEGYEAYLWEWLKLEASVGDEPSLPLGFEPRKRHRHSRRWKGSIIRAIVDAKLCGATCLDSALSSFLKAMDLTDSHLIPLAAASVAIKQEIRRDQSKRCSTDPTLYDRFIEAVLEGTFNGKKNGEFEAGVFMMLHPREPSPLLFLQCLRRLFDAPIQGNEWQTVRKLVYERRNSGEQKRQRMNHITAIIQLEDRGLAEDAAWVDAKTKELFPQFERFHESSKREFRLQEANDKQRTRTPSTKDVTGHESLHRSMPMPSFAV